MPRTGMLVVFLGVIAMLAAAELHAQDSGDVAGCVDIKDAQARLSCYDEVAGRGASPRGAPQASTAVPPVEPQPLTEEVGEEQLSGKSRPESEPESFRGRVTECKQDASKKWYFYFDNGQVWKQRANARLTNRNCDFEVTITKDSFGYKMQIVGESKKIRVGRIR